MTSSFPHVQNIATAEWHPPLHVMCPRAILHYPLHNLIIKICPQLHFPKSCLFIYLSASVSFSLSLPPHEKYTTHTQWCENLVTILQNCMTPQCHCWLDNCTTGCIDTGALRLSAGSSVMEHTAAGWYQPAVSCLATDGHCSFPYYHKPVVRCRNTSCLLLAAVLVKIHTGQNTRYKYIQLYPTPSSK